jgi:hypothetical protein
MYMYVQVFNPVRAPSFNWAKIMWRSYVQLTGSTVYPRAVGVQISASCIQLVILYQVKVIKPLKTNLSFHEACRTIMYILVFLACCLVP